MSKFKRISFGAVALIASVGAGLTGCDTAESPKPAASDSAATAAPGAAPATRPIIPVAQIKDWCPEHGVPESICVQCNESLAAGFKAKGDWDAEHGVPKSQCFKCDPSLREKFALAYKAKYGVDAPAGGDQ